MSVTTRRTTIPPSFCRFHIHDSRKLGDSICLLLTAPNDGDGGAPSLHAISALSCLLYSILTPPVMQRIITHITLCNSGSREEMGEEEGDSGSRLQLTFRWVVLPPEIPTLFAVLFGWILNELANLLRCSEKSLRCLGQPIPQISSTTSSSRLLPEPLFRFRKNWRFEKFYFLLWPFYQNWNNPLKSWKLFYKSTRPPSLSKFPRLY